MQTASNPDEIKINKQHYLRLSLPSFRTQKDLIKLYRG